MQRKNPATTPQPRLAAPIAALIEENPLTAWAVREALQNAYRVVQCADIAQAQALLKDPDTHVVICGSPVADTDLSALQLLTGRSDCRIVALVSATDVVAPPGVVVLEKPFALNRLATLISEPTTARTGPLPYEYQRSRVMNSLAERLARRFEKEVCPVCVHRTSSEGCTLTERHECPVFEWADRIAALVAEVRSPRLADYLDHIQSAICPDCQQDQEGQCEDRSHLDCPVDLYSGLIIPIIEEELERTQGLNPVPKGGAP